jgi:predicted permease
VNSFIADCRYAARRYARTPGSSLIAVVVLAIGIGFVGAFLSLYVDLALKPFPGIDDDGRLVTLYQFDGSRSDRIPFGLTSRMSEELTSLESVVGFNWWANLAVGRDGETVAIESASRGFFEQIRPELALGRGFEVGEHDRYAEPVVVISDVYWRSRYGGRADVLGQTIEFVPPAEEQQPTEFRIVGVMAPGLNGVMYDAIDLWVPLERFAAFGAGENGDYERTRSQAATRVLGRLRPGVTTEGLIREIQTRYPEPGDSYGLSPGFRIGAADGVVRDIGVFRDARRQLQMFLAGSILLGVVAASNVSLFILALAPGRRRELAIRSSIGASTMRLARQLATESAVLVAIAGVLGFSVSVWLASIISSLDLFRALDWHGVTVLDWRVLVLFGASLLVLTLLVSLAPMLALKRSGFALGSQHVTARASVAQQVVGTVQIALAATFAGAAIAFIWFLSPMLLEHPGYELKDRHAFDFYQSFSFDPTTGRTTTPDPERQREVIEALPGVRSVTFADLVPARQTALDKFEARDPDNPLQLVEIGFTNIDSRFVDVLGLRLLYGHVPADTEVGASLVNVALARRVFGRDDVVGEILEIETARAPRTEIIGVLEDLSYLHPGAEVEPIAFVNIPPPVVPVRGVIESPLSSAALRALLQDRAASGELELGSPNAVTPLASLRDVRIAPDRERALLTICTAVMVVLLAAFGFYGTQNYLVLAGRREYAIRAALGANSEALTRLVYGRGFVFGLPGLLVGLLMAFIVVSWLRGAFLSGDVSPGLVTLIVVLGLTLLLLAASRGPALAACRTQPASALRQD